MITKYAKDLLPGDKINGHEKGWITVEKVERKRFSSFVDVYFVCNDGLYMCDRFAVFDVIER